MAQVKVEVPNEKMQSFVRAIKSLGIDASGIIKKRYAKSVAQKQKISNSLKSFFGWEYFSNELEFE